MIRLSIGMSRKADPVHNPVKLRELASWYREFAERTENPMIWDARLRTAEDLETAAARVESESSSPFGASAR